MIGNLDELIPPKVAADIYHVKNLPFFFSLQEENDRLLMQNFLSDKDQELDSWNWLGRVS